jgi:hypothetical protein
MALAAAMKMKSLCKAMFSQTVSGSTPDDKLRRARKTLDDEAAKIGKPGETADDKKKRLEASAKRISSKWGNAYKTKLTEYIDEINLATPVQFGAGASAAAAAAPASPAAPARARLPATGKASLPPAINAKGHHRKAIGARASRSKAGDKAPNRFGVKMPKPHCYRPGTVALR